MGDDGGYIVFLLLSVALAFGLGCGVGASWTKREAAKAGAGWHIIDPVTGKADWSWNGQAVPD